MRDIERIRESAQRHSADEVLAVLRCVFHAYKRLEETRTGQQWADGIASDLVRTELCRQTFGALERSRQRPTSVLGDWKGYSRSTQPPCWNYTRPNRVGV